MLTGPSIAAASDNIYTNTAMSLHDRVELDRNYMESEMKLVWYIYILLKPFFGMSYC